MEGEDTVTRNLQKELEAAAHDTPGVDPPPASREKSGCSLLTPEKERRVPLFSGSPSFEFQSAGAASKRPAAAPAPPPDERTYTRDEVEVMITTAIRNYAQSLPQDNRPKRDLRRSLNEGRTDDEGDSYSENRGGDSHGVRTEVDSLRRDMNELKALRNRSMRDLVGSSPFAKHLDDDPIPASYRPISFEYNGTSDPAEHLSRFNNTASLHQLTEGVRCRAFATTLAGPAQAWFGLLPSGSMQSFEQFAKAFMNQFASSKKCKKTSLSLFSIRQKEKESLRSYIKRFTSATLEVPTTSDEVLMAALSQGLRDDEFFRALALEPSPDFDNLLERASRFINLEEARQQKVEESHQATNVRVSEVKRGKEPMLPRRDANIPSRSIVPDAKGSRFQSYQPLTAPLSQVLYAIEKRADLRWPRTARGAPRRDPTLGTFCRFHNEYGHTTDDCAHLKDEVERLIRDNKIGDFVKIDSPRGQKREAQFGNPPRAPPPPPAPKRGYIQMISGGPTGGDTHRARRRHLGSLKNNHEVCQISTPKYRHYPTISFSPEDETDLDDFHCDPLLITINVGGYDVARAFVDPGSSVDVISYECFLQMELDLPVFPVTTAIFGFTGGSLTPIGQVKIPVTIGTPPRTRTQTVNFVIVEGSPTSYNIVIGRPMLHTFRAVPSTIHQKLKFPVGGMVGEVRGDQAQSRSCYVEMVKIAEKGRRDTLTKEDLGDEKRPRVDPDDKVNHVQPMDELMTIDLVPGMMKQTRISKDLEPPLRDELIALLRSNEDIFAWQPSDLTGISPRTAVHRLNLRPECRPVKQKRRHFGTEKDEIIQKEVQRLLEIGHIREIQFPTWLSNAVLVQKANGQWRMCIDFRDLNKACPKDDYPLPRIDQLVDATAGCELLSMMDASQGYHQIPLDEKDQPAVSFVTATGTYCYVVMPFGLKNAGATYQRLMDRMFRAQLGRNIEVYVDDMLVKSKRRSTHLADLAETFATLRLYGMKLNPAKCAFAVQAGKFLGYIVNREGIKVNQDKVEAVLQMTPPRSIKEVQSLAGKVVALARFISRMADKSLPFFKLLRKTAQFEWTTECQLAFEALKRSLTCLPILSTPEKGETLFVYLSVGDESISSVLFKEVNNQQRPIYYTSKILTTSESRYSEVEKIPYALVLTTRRLRPYFLSHTMVIRTSLPLRQTLGQPTASGRIVKWAIELGQYEIQYQPRTSVKGQALADFIRETTRIPIEKEWKIYVDGSSTTSGAGAGIIVIDPTGTEVEFAVRLPRVSNNEAEYEAFIRGMEIAQELGARVVRIYSDSQLVIHQLEGDYETKNDRMKSYVNKARAVQETFEVCTMHQIPRNDNQRADFLAKVGSSVVDCIERKITILIAPTPTPGIMTIDEEPDWRTPLFKYFRGERAGTKREQHRLAYKARHFYVRHGTLYKRNFTTVDARCLGKQEVTHVLDEVHRGGCGEHGGARALMQKLHRAGYYWPGMKKDTYRYVQHCIQCQKYASLIHKPGEEMTIMSAPCPFAQWGIDLVGPFPQTTGRKKFIIVAVDYFTKWVEAEALSKISEDEVMHFIWKNICCRFGLPRSLVSDNGTQFNGKKIRAWCEEMKIAQKFVAVAHPQANGQVESVNRTIVNGLKKRLDELGGSWVDELPSVLWSYRTTSKAATGETPFRLTYGTEAVIPVEVAMDTLRIAAFDEVTNDDALRSQLDEVFDLRETAYLHMERSKNLIKARYDQGVRSRSFQIGDLVLRRADALKHTGKLEANWEGPYTVTRCLAGGGYELADIDGKPLPRAWNIIHLKRFFA
ncbi:PREDICTED: uncharacterized protein LOC105962516 [Erythranthe guttata]|uniref:uncharacterized protein LOC105962516 n=1 Tax=Erythranthe guttata TaxID=4155 RepID=UPI00064DFF29|nr:PREDICTED: uncharacterized protein LOC105962516 [Erythranthe guttata]|eukprot:XP_012842286.1 PREDICTED: uncharacterized protein LOC105962516 [Erythranthe guttata]